MGALVGPRIVRAGPILNGTQVSGTIQTLGADFNSIVKRGQVLAGLDPSLFQTQGELTEVRVQVGLSVSQATEILSGALKAGDLVAIRVSTADATRPQTVASPFQFMQPPGTRLRSP